MDPIYLHAKRVNARFLALITVAKDEEEGQELRDEAHDMIAAWPKTHTFCVKNDEDAVRVTWAKCFKDDTFSKKEGKKVSSEKMDRLIANPPRTILTLDLYNDSLKEDYGEGYEEAGLKTFLFDHLPACVADTLPWYLSRAVAYYKIDENKKVIIEGSTAKEDWSMYPEQRKRVAIISYTEALSDLL